MSAEIDQVRDAEQEAAEAEALAEALEEAVRSGDESVGPDDVERAKALGRFARLRQVAAARKADAAREAARLKDCRELAAEITKESAGGGSRYADLAQGAIDALDDFVAALLERNERIEVWTRRAGALGVPESATQQADHGALGWLPYPSGPAVISGDVRLSQTAPVGFVNLILGEVAQAHRLSVGIQPVSSEPGTVVAELAKIDSEHAR
jgi:hypothetical protein